MLGKILILLSIVYCSSELCDENRCERSINSRISGSDITEQNSRPFQVALYLRVGTLGEVGFCGGSLVQQEWILTAAHCCFHDGQQVDHVQAILGAHSLYDRYENGRRIVNVDEIVIHPDWEPSTFANDLALLRLANVIQLTETINVIQLPYLNISAINFAGQGGTISGWGIAAEGVTFVAPTLREKLMTVLTDPFCNTSYSNLLPPNMVCGFSSNSGTCKGDNGGPFTIWHNSTETTILIGVASFVSTGGCNQDFPSVFTRVQRFLPWIADTTGINLV